MDEGGEPVHPGVPAALPQPPARDGRLTRLDLAEWLTTPENPLTARVVVNRLWKLYFGAGLSRRLDDVGAQGEWPSHPLLLDWLAGRLIDSGWDLKKTVKTIVMSSTYRPSVSPYQPAGYWAYLNFPTREWQNGTGDELYRRGLYTHWQRQYLHPSLLAFDAPTREECAADRPRSNTPLQTLVLMNDPTYVEASRALAESILRSGGVTTADRIRWAMRRALSRSPEPAEAQVLEQLVAAHLAEYRQDPTAAGELIAVGARPVPPDLDPAELAAEPV
jgi:hypothetical protein